MASNYGGKEGYAGNMSGPPKDMGKEARVPCLSKHSLGSKDAIYVKDLKGGQPANMPSTRVYGSGKAQGGSRAGTTQKSFDGRSMKKGKDLSHKGR